MSERFADIAFTPAVRRFQERSGSRVRRARSELAAATDDRLGRAESEFIRERDSVYLATVSETGWPYVQHRGGPKGFLKVLDAGTLGFADFRGNRQYVSAGNLEGNDRVALLLMDYANRLRLKVLGRARTLAPDEDPALMARLRDPGYRGRAERAVLVRVEAFDWNCPLHITPRYSAEEGEGLLASARERIRELERRLAALSQG